jgi:hypothetical protein
MFVAIHLNQPTNVLLVRHFIVATGYVFLHTFALRLQVIGKCMEINYNC